VAITKLKEAILKPEQHVDALREQKDLAIDRFYDGVGSYLEVLDQTGRYSSHN
jgi:outer membrane protein TolC